MAEHIGNIYTSCILQKKVPFIAMQLHKGDTEQPSTSQVMHVCSFPPTLHTFLVKVEGACPIG